jgi:hypothetical protein
LEKMEYVRSEEAWLSIVWGEEKEEDGFLRHNNFKVSCTETFLRTSQHT